MRVSEIVSKINTKLAGEILTKKQLIPYIDEVIDDINTELSTTFPTMSELETKYANDEDVNYDCFPDRYIRSVVVVGAAYKFYITDEEGNMAAQQYSYDYRDNMFAMLRDYSIQVPDEYSADVGYIKNNNKSIDLQKEVFSVDW